MPDKRWIDAIKQVLGDANGSMSRVEIADEITSRSLRKNVGATPANTVATYISTSIREDREKSPFVKTGRGQYSLRSKLNQENSPEKFSEADDLSVGGVQAFGVYWARDSVNWSRKPKLLGEQQLDSSTEVDMCEQIGIYLLYDQREAIYVGRATDRPIGIRLWEHTRDRLGSRWDRFSWFGFYGVGQNGRLKKSVPKAEPSARG